MKFLLRTTLVFEAIFFLLVLRYMARPDAIVQVITMLFAVLLFVPWLAVLITALSLSHRDQHYRMPSAVVLILAPASLFVALFVGSHIRDYLFYRDLPRLKEMVTLIKDGSLQTRNERIEIPDRYKGLAYSIHSDSTANGGLMVTFFVGSGFPVKHLCYVYRSDDAMTDDMKDDWHIIHRREKHWFEVSD